MDSRTTHHDRILADLRDKITGGDWPPGFQLPFETVLAEQHGVSRMTMNKVLAQLTREGYLLRRKKLGTFVAQPMAQAAVMAITDIEAEVKALGLPWRFALTVRDLRAPLAAECISARITDPAPVLALQGVHFAGEQPFCHEARIINPAAAPGALSQDFRSLAPGQWLLREIPWTSAEHRIRAINATPAIARALALSPGEACLDVTRRTEAAGQWVTLVTQTYPGTRHELVSRFTPDER
ncbi:MAG: UTRA domain-containing protein [Pseudotabrizicola sp.]|uniref:UTRA domain-containing protein n=1 Tax=Pseudotabrizicola sp. TaxID=2939647 RepID=UPI002722276E|nr:UTRA domain-containing protein [Pseudotabrizicola sp.]MDO8883469.1 UTRA domain-containing protein [Pseudotabrizicola sp.]MDP2082519.1 UTRA domain-containing protein [Pseudotabrizicola sp.]MDZ7573970.1 UTRA domain-containing protein [Pseudotabrizicola sp.]